MIDLSCEIAGVRFKNPIIMASGTFGFGREYENFFDLDKLGGISVKGLTLNKREGNPSPRVCETYSGILNSVGLQNPGVQYFVDNELPYLKQKNTVIIANLSGSNVDEYIKGAEILSNSDVDMIELNISCPNVKEGGVAFGVSCSSSYEVTKKVKEHSSKPVIVKLSPNVTNIAEIALSVQDAKADAISLINTILGMQIDINSKRPILKNNVGGLSGPCVFPVALRMVYEVCRVVNIPVIAMGGITTYEDALQMLIAGASCLQIGTAIFNDPYAPLNILDGIYDYFKKNNISKLSDIINTLQLWEN